MVFGRRFSTVFEPSPGSPYILVFTTVLQHHHQTHHHLATALSIVIETTIITTIGYRQKLKTLKLSNPKTSSESRNQRKAKKRGEEPTLRTWRRNCNHVTDEQRTTTRIFSSVISSESEYLKTYLAHLKP